MSDTKQQTEQAGEIAEKRRVLPTDRIPVEKQFEILKAFAAVYAAKNKPGPVTNEEAGSVLTPPLAEATVLLTNPFFVDIGLLERSTTPASFVPSLRVRTYGSAALWNEKTAREELKPVFEEAWFWRSLRPKLQLANQNKGICIQALAIESKAKKEHEAKLVRILGFLEYVGLIQISGEVVKIIMPQQSQPPPPQIQQPQPKKGEETRRNEFEFSELEENSLFLDKERQKKVTLSCPLFLTKAEYDRICNWIKATWIIEEKSPDQN